MYTPEMREAYKKIFEHRGRITQIRKLDEEHVELLCALDGFGDILDEIADNLNMIGQFILAENLNIDEIMDRMQLKNERELGRIANEQGRQEKSGQVTNKD